MSTVTSSNVAGAFPGPRTFLEQPLGLQSFCKAFELVHFFPAADPAFFTRRAF